MTPTNDPIYCAECKGEIRPMPDLGATVFGHVGRRPEPGDKHAASPTPRRKRRMKKGGTTTGDA